MNEAKLYNKNREGTIKEWWRDVSPIQRALINNDYDAFVGYFEEIEEALSLRLEGGRSLLFFATKLDRKRIAAFLKDQGAELTKEEIKSL